MKTRIFLLAAFGISWLLGSNLASAQTLGDLARATRDKRMKVMQQKSVRIWTNDNMPRRPASEGPTASTGMSPAPLSTAEAASEPPPPPADSGEEKVTKESWQQRFKSLRMRLASMEEQQRLAEDELSLLQVQQARELSPDTQGQLESNAKAASATLEARRAETAKARKELEDLEKEFKASGAPADWSKTD